MTAELDQREERLESEVADSSSALMPLMSMGIDDVRDGARVLLESVRKNPLIAARNAWQMAVENARILGGNVDVPVSPGDKRFGAPEWEDSRYYSTIKQLYLSTSRSMKQWLDESDLEPLKQKQAEFLLDLLIGAMSPTNNWFTNPAGPRTAIESKGISAIKGVRNAFDDLVNNSGFPSQADRSKFTVGKNLACSPGAVVFQSELLELIQYQPQTEEVCEKPVFFATSMVNKFYVCDLTPERSLFKDLINNGSQLFAVSWRNPGKRHRNRGFAEYVLALVEAMDVAHEIAGTRDMNYAGLCAGGSMIAIALAYLAETRAYQASSVSLLVNVLDNRKDDTEIGGATSASLIELSKKRTQEKGIYSEDEMLLVFSLMKPDAFIWGSVERNYVCGNDPLESEVMFWTQDQTGLTADFHTDILDQMLDNRVVEGRLEICGTMIDLTKISCDAFVLGAERDHLTKWHAVYRTTKLLSGDSVFVLSAGGHITPIITPVGHPKSSYYFNEDHSLGSDEWLAGATRTDESWRIPWMEWLQERSGDRVPSPEIEGSEDYPVLGDAPGRYVHG